MSGESNIVIPKSALAGVIWPAIPGSSNAMVLALVQQFESSQWWPAETLGALQWRQLGPLLVHASRTAPLYRGRLGRAGEPGGLNPETWARVPVLERSHIQEAGPDLFSRKIPDGHGPVASVSTSGSTGAPVTVKNSRITALFFNALNLRYHLWHGRDLSARAAAITRPMGSEGKSLYWVPGYVSGPMATFDVTRPPAEQLAWLAETGPAYLLTYPSNLHALVEQSLESGTRIPGLREVSAMGEALDDHVRETCEREWGVPVIDLYSTQEVGMIALQCPDAPHYHVQSENVIVEILDDDGNECPPGEVGRVVVTDLHNFASPLIRYALGDYAEVGDRCPCGRGLPVLTRIMGRSRNMLSLPGGGHMWPVFTHALFTACPEIRQVQLYQPAVEEIEARLVTARPLTSVEEDEVRGVLDQALNGSFRIRLRFMDEIPRAPGGKFEDVISNLGEKGEEGR